MDIPSSDLAATFEALRTRVELVRAELVHLRATNAALADALKGLLDDIDAGRLVRNIEADGDPDWTRHMVAFVQRLHAANDALAKAKGTT